MLQSGDRLELRRGVGHLLHGQPLLALSTLEHALRHPAVRRPQTRLSDIDGNLRESAACRAVDDCERARLLIIEVERDFGVAPPDTMAQRTDHLLLQKHARCWKGWRNRL